MSRVNVTISVNQKQHDQIRTLAETYDDYYKTNCGISGFYRRAALKEIKAMRARFSDVVLDQP